MTYKQEIRKLKNKIKKAEKAHQKAYERIPDSTFHNGIPDNDISIIDFFSEICNEKGEELGNAVYEYAEFALKNIVKEKQQVINYCTEILEISSKEFLENIDLEL